jgi:hypothetical protein
MRVFPYWYLLWKIPWRLWFFFIIPWLLNNNNNNDLGSQAYWIDIFMNKNHTVVLKILIMKGEQKKIKINHLWNSQRKNRPSHRYRHEWLIKVNTNNVYFHFNMILYWIFVLFHYFCCHYHLIILFIVIVVKKNINSINFPFYIELLCYIA